MKKKKLQHENIELFKENVKIRKIKQNKTKNAWGKKNHHQDGTVILLTH